MIQRRFNVGHRLRRCANIEPTLDELVVFMTVADKITFCSTHRWRVWHWSSNSSGVYQERLWRSDNRLNRREAEADSFHVRSREDRDKPGEWVNIALRHVLHIEAITRQKEARSRDNAYSYFEWLQGFFIVHSTIDSTIHPRHFNSLDDCICTTTMINIRPDRESNLVPSGYKPKSIRMSQWVRPRDKPGCQIYLPSKHEALA